MALEIKSELPMLKVPISLIVDDWSVGYVKRGGEFEYKRAHEFLLDFLRLGNMNVRGKLSLIPCIVKLNKLNHKLLGRVDEGISGIPREILERVLDLVKREATKYFDITPEMLTHSLAVDIDTNELLNETEWEWSQRQNLNSLTRYIAKALSILRNVGIIATGVTSPCDFGREVEGIYARATLEAEKLINNIKLAWYFLHVEKYRSYVTPRLMYFDENNEEAVVSIISCSKDYLGKSELDKASGDPYKLADNWITADGKKGRLVELYKNRSYLVFHTHWWNVHRDEDKVGFRALVETISRINKLLGDNVVWMKCSDIARYFAVSKVFKWKVINEEDTSVIFESPFICKNFTISIESKRPIKHIKVDECPLRRVKDHPLIPNSWKVINGKVYACFDLSRTVKLDIKFE